MSNISDMIQTVPPLEELFDDQAHRLAGIVSWEQIACLGSANIERLIQLAQETVRKMMASEASSSELHAMAPGITRLKEYLADAPKKPLLPRLRVESFRKNDEVALYVADSEGCLAPTAWVRAVITDVKKAHKREWVDGSPNSGYFWRWTATAQVPIFAEQPWVEFSTSEPRILPLWELDYLRRAKQDDPPFLDIFVRNAYRTWCPLWCLERGAGCAGEAMDMRQWLFEGSGPENIV